MEKLEELLEKGGIKKDITFLVISAHSVGYKRSRSNKSCRFDAAYIRA